MIELKSLRLRPHIITQTIEIDVSIVFHSMNNMVDKIENMNRKTKTILSVVGVCAVVVPALLLWYVASNTAQEPKIDSSSRSMSGTPAKSTQTKPAVKSPIPTAKPASASAVPAQSTSSAQ